jgi:protein-tyrosine-phosphatase
MAEALANAMAPADFSAISAGTAPAERLNPTVVKAMEEVGIDMSSHSPKLLTPAMLESADLVISMGCGVEESCPIALVGAQDWALEDPANQPIERVRQIRDEIKRRVEDLLRPFSGDRAPSQRGSTSEAG